MDIRRLSLQNILETTILILLGVFILCLPYYWHQSSYILGVACGLSLIDRIFFLKFKAFKTKAWQHYTWAFAPLFALFILDLIGMLYTPVPKEGALRLEKHLSFIAFPLLFALLGPDFFNLKRLKGLGIVFYANCLFLVFMFLSVTLSGGYNEQISPVAFQNILPAFLHPLLQTPAWGIMAKHCHFFLLHHAYQSWLMITAMNMITVTWILYPQWYKAWYLKTINILLLLIFSCIGTLMSGAHIGFVALVLWGICVFGLLLFKRHYKTAIGSLAAVVGIISLCMISFPSLWYRTQRASKVFVSQIAENNEDSKDDNQTRPHDGSVYPRLMMWKDAVDCFKQKPLLGHGTAGEKNPELLENHTYLQRYRGNAHNDWMLYAIRFGLVGLIFLAAVWVAGFRYAYLSKNPLLFIFLLFALVFTQTDSWLNYQIGITFFCLFYGLLVSFSEATKDVALSGSALTGDPTGDPTGNPTGKPL